MSYTTLLVHIDAEGDSGNRVGIAVDLAKRSQSALIGIGGWSPGMGFAADVAVIDDEPVKHQTEELTALMTAAEHRFRTAAKDIKHVEWRGELRLPSGPSDARVASCRPGDHRQAGSKGSALCVARPGRSPR